LEDFMQSRPTLAPEHVSQYFTASRGLYRILADGSMKEVTYLEGGRLLAVVGGEKLFAPDIAWCLHYGNWPKYPLVQLDGDPFNCSLDNLMPARVKRLRYRQKEVDGRFYHSLAPKLPFRTAAECRRNWTAHARDHYAKDLDYVLEVEARERELRAAAALPAAPLPLVRARRAERAERAVPVGARPPRPMAVDGMEWHWWEGAWISVPVACHVADDYRVRIEKWLKGAVRFVFQPEYQEVWALRADCSVVH
jgi:hypothetical protein